MRRSSLLERSVGGGGDGGGGGGRPANREDGIVLAERLARRPAGAGAVHDVGNAKLGSRLDAVVFAQGGRRVEQDGGGQLDGAQRQTVDAAEPFERLGRHHVEAPALVVDAAHHAVAETRRQRQSVQHRRVVGPETKKRALNQRFPNFWVVTPNGYFPVNQLTSTVVFFSVEFESHFIGWRVHEPAMMSQNRDKHREGKLSKNFFH